MAERLSGVHIDIETAATHPRLSALSFARSHLFTPL
jgi:hypothetical protein